MPHSTSAAFSCSPSGELFPLPQRKNYAKEFARLKCLAAEHRRKGREVVVVMGVGFVGAVMAGVIADSIDRKSGQPGKFRNLKLKGIS